MSIELAIATILKSGPGSSIQDLGRLGSCNFGVPVSGAMDRRSVLWINHLLKNQKTDAVIEISQPGFAIRFGSATHLSLAGAKAAVRLNGVEISNSTQIHVQVDDVLETGAFILGARIYIGVRHGFQTPEILGSRSFYKSVTEKTALSAGDTIAYFKDFGSVPNGNAKAIWSTDWFQTNTIYVYRGVDFDLLTDEVKRKLFEQTFTLSPLANRMGIQLQELVVNSLPELPTNPVFPGTVQLTSGGKLVILLQDAQVTGGYPRILHLTVDSQNVMAQKKPGDSIQFKLVNEREPRLQSVETGEP